MSSFWKSEDLIPISQKKVSILAQHGLNYSAGQRIDFEVPANLTYINPKESYLSVTAKISIPAGLAPTLLCFDGRLGGQALISRINIYSGNDELLEEIEDYQVLQGVRFDYSTNSSIEKKRALTEGCLVPSIKNRGTNGTTETEMNNVTNNPWFNTPTGTPQTVAFDSTEFNEVKMLIPLHTGIFSPDSRVFPVSKTSGLKVSIILAPPRLVLRQLDSVLKDRRPKLNPQFHSLNGSTTGPTSWISGSAHTAFYVSYANNNINCDNFPFVVGQKFRFVNPDTMTATSTAITNEDITSNGADDDFVIERIEFEVSAAINASKGLIKITVPASTASGSDVLEGKCVMYSTSVDSEASYEATYNLSNVEMIVEQVEMPDAYTNTLNNMMKSGGVMNYDFLTWTNYKYSQQREDRVANIRLPLLNSRVKSILFCPVDATVRTTKQALQCSEGYIESLEPDDIIVRSNSGGVRSIYDFLTEYQIFQDGRLNPNRKVQCGLISNKKSIEQQPLIELEKALHMMKMDVHSFKNFRANGCLGRAMSLQDGVVNLQGKTIDLQAEYREADAPQFPKLWMNYVASLRRLTISNDNNITVEL
jgi:hypothetical protein